MRRLIALALVLAGSGPAFAAGILIPEEKQVPPLAMVDHRVTIDIEDQVATTKVEQTFRNHTDRKLEATYIFPVPAGAAVREFSLWVDGKKVAAELVEAKKAQEIYTSMVARTQDPALLEYMGHNLLKVRVAGIQPNKDQKITFRYQSVIPSDHGTLHYTYPLKTDGRAIQTLKTFAINVRITSQHAVQNIYSPTHAISVTRPSDKVAHITFEKEQGLLDRNFDLFYNSGTKDVGLTALTHRPSSGHKGYFMLLASPRAELAKEKQAPRDIVFVLDTSGSMRGKRIEQARNALKYCLSNLNKQDRFAVIHFATTVNNYAEQWLPADEDNIIAAKKWVDRLEATGGTAINDALAAALQMRTADKARTFTVVFFTDGQPTVGETNTEVIVKNVLQKNSANTRIFTFGVGDDVNATMLDQIAEYTRAVSTYVRETENIEEKVSSLYSKISHPVLTNLRLTVNNGVTLSEVYPPQLPDLFHGSQLVILGRYEGDGHAAVKLAGNVGKEEREFVYEVAFPKKSAEEKPFVEDLWARRKVGYLLDQIRRNGEQKELVEEIVTLAKRYGITTPYTSYLIVPDAPTTVTKREVKTEEHGRPNVAFHLQPTPTAPGRGLAPDGTPPALQRDGLGGGSGKSGPNPVPPTGSAKTVNDFIQEVQKKPGDAAQLRDLINNLTLKSLDDQSGAKGGKDVNSKPEADRLKEIRLRYAAFTEARQALQNKQNSLVQNGRLGVDLSVEANNLRNQTQLERTAVCRVQNRNVLEVGGVWIDEDYHAKLKTVTVKAMSKAYFRILERHPQVRDVFRLGNHLVWVTPSGTALVIDTAAGQEEMTDAEIDALFTAPKK